MMKRRRLLIAGSLIAGICFLLGFLGSFQLPKVRSWILVKVEQFSRDHLPVRVLPSSIDVDLFPLGTTLKGVKIFPKEEAEKFIDPLEIRSLSVSISPWQLIQGRMRLTDVTLSGATVSVRVPKSEKKSPPPLEGFFALLSDIPVNRIRVEDLAVRFKLESPRLQLEISEIDVTAQKYRGALAIDLVSATVHAQEEQAKNKVRLELETNLLFARDAITISALKARRGESYLVASGDLKGDTEAFKFTDLDLSVRSELLLDSVRVLALKGIVGEVSLPSIKGRAFFDGKIARAKGAALESTFALRTEGLRLLDQFLIDRVETNGTFKNGVIELPKSTIENPAGSVHLAETVIETQGGSRLKTQAKIPRMELQELFKTLGLPDIPVWLQTSGQFPCEAQFSPGFHLSCKGKARGENLLVRDSLESQSTIVAIREFDATGEFSVDEEKVTYSAELSMPGSKGRSQGVISYATGFKIGYEADHLNLKDITNLANLKLEGDAKVKGSTEGDSHAATLKMDVDGNDIWFEDFWLGAARTQAQYKAGDLTFSNLDGHYTVSRYNGDVKVNLNRMDLNVIGRVPFYDSKDLLAVFSRKVKLPFAVSGTGQAQIKVSGPLEFTKLSYELKSSLFRGAVAGEPFDQANFDITAKRGEVRTDRVQLTKGPALFTLTGSGHPDGTIKTIIQGRGLKLEDSTLITSTGLSLAGLAEFDMDMHGPILHPDTDLRGTLTRMTIGDQAVPDSSVRLKFNARTIEGGGVFLGDVMKADFVIPLDEAAPFSIKIRTQDWNFAPMFAAVSGPGTRKDFDGRLTADIDLSSPSGGFWNASGTIDVAEYSIARGSLALRSQDPISMTMKNGQLGVKRFNLVGENTFFRVEETKNPTSKIDVQVNGKLDMSLFALLTPFFEDLRGILSFAFNVKAGPATTELLGSAYIEKGYLKFFDFPHPFENIQADLLFNQRKILFNTLKSEFGGGRINASGGMEIKGYKNYPLSISGSFDKVTLNVPDDVKTTGSGQLTFSGSWFPFLLKGEYDVKDGLFSKEFSGESGPGNSGIRRDYFLPELLLQDSFVPVVLDLQINFPRGIQVKNELVEGRAIGAFSVRGNPTKPSVLGTITTDKDTKIYFKDSEFEVTSSNIQFTDPNDLNPRLYLAARSRVSDHDINLLVQGTGSKPDILLSSVPPLPEKDIISLLALGATDSQLNDKVSSNEQASSTGLNIGSGVLKKNPISDVIQEKLGFNVQFSPGFDDTTNSAVQKIIVSRQFSNKLGVTASQSFGGKKKTSEAQMRYRLNERVSVIGSWQGKTYDEAADSTDQTQQDSNLIGLDIEYKFEFK